MIPKVFWYSQGYRNGALGMEHFSQREKIIQHQTKTKGFLPNINSEINRIRASQGIVPKFS